MQTNGLSDTVHGSARDLSCSFSDGVTMPAKGKYEKRDYTAEEAAAIRDGATALELSEAQALDCLGSHTYDIYLNGDVFWRNVPEKVWTYTLGGYQVVKKWLSYREHKLLGRPLSREEALYVTDMIRRIAALLLLGPALDRNYEAVKANNWAWATKTGSRGLK